MQLDLSQDLPDDSSRGYTSHQAQPCFPQQSASASSSRGKSRWNHKPKAASTSEGLTPPFLSRVNSTDRRFYANLPDKIKRRHLTEEERLLISYLRRQSSIARSQGAQSFEDSYSSRASLESPMLSPGLSESSPSTMFCRHGEMPNDVNSKQKQDSFYDSFRWLEEDDSLDLRLFLDDYHINLREEIPVPKNRRPSFRRHLSISKLPFGRPPPSFISNSRPPTQDACPSSATSTFSPSPTSSSPTHGRRKSRALSLISAGRQSPIDTTQTIDPAATHYQDPEARKKLRICLQSPQKFDEALQFGFPSMDASEAAMGKRKEVRPALTDGAGKQRSFLEDDRSSNYSDDVSVAETESPKTPEAFEKPTPVRPTPLSTDPPTGPRNNSSQGSLSREMTLRMTLTRPDLRSNEEQIYRFKQAKSRRASHKRDVSSAGTVTYARDENAKNSLEKQLASFDWDDETAAPDSGVVKRFWNKVRRS